MLNKALIATVFAVTAVTSHAAESSNLAKYGNDLCTAIVNDNLSGTDDDDDQGVGCYDQVTVLVATDITAAELTQKICRDAADYSPEYEAEKDGDGTPSELAKLAKKAVNDCFKSSPKAAQDNGVTL